MVSLTERVLRTLAGHLMVLRDRCNNKCRRNRLLVIQCHLRYHTSDRLNLSRAGISAGRPIRQANAFRVHLSLNNDLRLIQHILVSRTNFRLVLRRTIQHMNRAHLLLTFKVRRSRIPNSVLRLHLNAFLRLFPDTYTRLTRLEQLTTLFPLMFQWFVRKVSTSRCGVIVLVGRFSNLLRLAIRLNTCRTSRLSCTVISVCSVVPLQRLIRLLRQGNSLSTSYLVTLRIRLIRTIRRLVINRGTST